MIKDIKYENLKEETKSGISVLDIWADWCSSCGAIKQALPDLAAERPDVNFLLLDANTSQDAMIELGIRSLPTIIVFKDGTEVNRFMGFTSKEQFLSEIPTE